MIYDSALRARKITADRLKEYFTASEGEDKDNADKFRKMVQSRTQEGIERGLLNSQFYLSSDIAWDTSINVGEFIPLTLYAQGKLTADGCKSALEKISADTAKKYLKTETNAAGKKKVLLDVPKFFEVVLPIVRSYISIRRAALSARYEKLTPFFKYSPRVPTEENLLRSEILSNRIDVMANQYGYKDLQDQLHLHMLKYGDVLMFVSKAWDEVKQLDADAVESLVKEGLKYRIPHPSRVFWDNSSPLASINTDTDCNFLGYWDVRRRKEVYNNPAYYNTEALSSARGDSRFIQDYPLYFSYYFNLDKNCTINPGAAGFNTIGAGSTYANDRVLQTGALSHDLEDEAITVTESFHKVNPKDMGIGDYDYPVWIRVITAIDDIVIYAEPIPYTPAVSLSYKPDDTRQRNLGMAHEMLWAQDQMSNLMSQWLMSVKQNMMSFVLANRDLLDEEDIKAIMDASNTLYQTVNILPHSFNKLMARMGASGGQLQAIDIIKGAGTHDVTQFPVLMGQLLAMLERLLQISPAEAGQASKYEPSAREVTLMSQGATTTLEALFSRVDSMRAAWKQQLLESTLNFADEDTYTQISKQYSAETLSNLGITVEEDFKTGRSVRVSKDILKGDYVFNSQDGAERTSDAQMANAMVQLYGIIAKDPEVAQRMGLDNRIKLISSIAKYAGAGSIEFTTQGPDQEQQVPNGAVTTEQLQQILQQLQQQIGQALQQTAQGTQQNAQEIQTLEQAFKQLMGQMAGSGALPPPQPAQTAEQLTISPDNAPVPEQVPSLPPEMSDIPAPSPEAMNQPPSP